MPDKMSLALDAEYGDLGEYGESSKITFFT